MPSLLVFTPAWGFGPQPLTLETIAALEWDGTLTHEIGWHNPYPSADWRNVTAQYMRARELFLAGDYDALLTVEHDMVIPSDAAALLWQADAPVAYGVYRLGMGLTLNARGMGGHLCKDRIETDIADVLGVGLGCTLIRRSVLEAIEFRYHELTGTCDESFATDCIQHGYRQVARFDVACGHMRNGLVLLPYSDPETGLLQACTPN